MKTKSFLQLFPQSIEHASLSNMFSWQVTKNQQCLLVHCRETLYVHTELLPMVAPSSAASTNSP